MAIPHLTNAFVSVTLTYDGATEAQTEAVRRLLTKARMGRNNSFCVRAHVGYDDGRMFVSATLNRGVEPAELKDAILRIFVRLDTEEGVRA